MFSYCESVAGRAQVVDRQTFEALITRPGVQQICDQIAATVHNASMNDRDRQDAVGALKRRLPAFCWHAWFDDGVRKNDRAHASGLVMIDLDHLEDPKRVWEGLVGDSSPMYLQGHRLMAAHITPSTQGLRLVFERPMGTLSLEDAQAIIVRDLGLTGVDTCTKDLARLSFCVPKGYWLWVDYQKIFEPATAQNDPSPAQNAIAKDDPSPALPNDPSPALPNDPSPALPREGDGKSQSAVRSDATNVTYPPNYETTHTISSSPRGGREGVAGPGGGPLSGVSKVSIPYPLLVEKLQEQLGGVPAHGSRNNFIFAMAAYLRYVCDDDPEWIAQILPTYGENRERWRRTIDSACQRSQLIQMPQIVRRAIENAKKETERPTNGRPTPDPSLLEGRGHNCGAVDSEVAAPLQEGGDGGGSFPPPMPTRLPKLIAHLVSDMTNAAFVQRMKDAGGRYLYTNLEELDLLRQLQTNGTKDVGKIICLCFDNGKYGQERVGTQSVTARVDLRWNWNASSTIQKGIQFFANRLVDGTLSRINLCTIVPDASRPFVYGRYDQRYGEVLKPYITNLNLASGHVECRQALDLARRMDAECQEVAALTDDKTYCDLTHRAVTIAYLKAMVLYIANGGKWSREIGEFARWSLDYDLWCKCHFFGEAIAEAQRGEVVHGSRGRKNLLELLPDEFTREQAEVVRRQQGLKDDGSGMLRLWVFRGYVVRTERGYKKVRETQGQPPSALKGAD